MSVSPTRNSSGRTKRQTKVGSYGESVNYRPDERVFNKMDMPEKARQARLDLQVQLEEQKKRWHSETQLFYHCRSERRSTEIRAFDPTEYDYNFRAEQLPAARPVVKDVWGRPQRLVLDGDHFHRTQEIPTHPNLTNKSWDDTGTIDYAQVARIHSTKVKRAQSLSHRRSARVLEHAEMTGRPLPTLVQREEQRMATLRAQRQAKADELTEELYMSIAEYGLAREDMMSTRNAVALKERYKPAHPAPPLHAVVTDHVEKEYADIWTHKTREREQLLASTRRKQVALRHKHTGSFGPLAGGTLGGQEEDDSDDEGPSAAGQYGWSCCGASAPGAPGCVVVEKDLQAHNYSGI